MKHILIILVIAITFSACQKKDTTTPDASKVTINITSPVPAQVFRNGDTMHMVATVSYPSELHGYELKISDSATGNILYDEDEHVHNDHFEINSTWVDTATTAATLKLELTVEVDHAGTEAEKTIYFNYVP